MPDKKDDTIIGAIGGVLAAAGGTALYDWARKKAEEFVQRKATEVFVDRGRGPILRDILSLPTEKAAKLRAWLDEAQKEDLEGHFVNLLLKLPDNPQEGRRKELDRLSELSSYNEFVRTLSILDQDNFFQLAQRVVKNGGKFADGEVKQFLACLGETMKHAGTTVNNAAKTSAPHLHNLADWIRSKG